MSQAMPTSHRSQRHLTLLPGAGGHRRTCGAWALIVPLILITPTWAVRPATWVIDTEAEFSTGTLEQTVVTDLGDVKLGMATAEVAALPENATLVFDLARDSNGALYLATGPEAKVWRLGPADESPVEILAHEREQIFAIAVVNTALLVAVSGDGTTRLERIVGDTSQVICTLPDTRYIWDVTVADGHAYLATGSDGKIFRVDLAREGPDALREVFDATQSNILCLGMDTAGVLYAGTDDGGLLFRIDFGEDDAVSTFVLYDADEPEIGTLHVSKDGTVYVGTADAKQAKPGRLTAPSNQSPGRPVTPASAEPAKPVEPVPPSHPSTPSPTTTDPVVPEAEPSAPDGNPPPGDDPENPTMPETDPGPTSRPHDMADPQADAWLEQTRLLWLAQKRGPTPEQFDTLRLEISRRLTAAREGAEMAALEPTQAEAQVRGGSSPATTRSSPDATAKPRKPSKKGNAVYRIGPDGMVEELMRESVMVLHLTEHTGRLIVGTGNEGQVYQIDLDTLARALLVDLEAQQVTTLLAEPEGVLLGTASPAAVLRLEGKYATEGTFTSKVHDTGQVALWGRLHLRAETPAPTGIKLELRSGNVKDPDQAAWSAWHAAPILDVAPSRGPMTPRELAVEVPPARFIQFRATLDGDSTSTPTLHHVQLAHVTANQRPRITEVKAGYGTAVPAKSARGGSSAAAAVAPKHVAQLRIEWKATDPNGDRLVFNLDFQPEGSTRWITLAEDVSGPRHTWNTALVPDGRYLLRVTADDRLENTPDMAMTASRIADPITVDNTPPTLEGLTVVAGENEVSMTGAAVDALSHVAGIHYMVNGTEPWLPALPKDLIFDSTREAFAVTIQVPKADPHVITLKVGDGRANVLYHQILLDAE